jgi:HEAT repeat protein
MAVSKELKALVDQMPEADDRDMYTGEMDKEKIEKAVAEMCRDGRASVVGLVDMLGEPGSDADVKPHYALHCLVNHALIVGDQGARKAVAETLAGELSGDRPKHVKAFLCQELQWAGGQEAVAGLAALLEDADLVEPAAMALVAIREGAAEALRAALPKAKGKCRLNIVEGLGALEDAQSAPALREALDDPDVEVRLAAGWALARLGDAASVEFLLEAANCEPGWERIQATKHCLVLAEKLSAAGRRDLAQKVYQRLRDSRRDGEQYVREIAEKALAAG